jgi:Na+/proline symporter
MNPGLVISVLIGYFLLLILISYLTGRKADNSSFFVGNRKSPWYVVAFGMIGASLSGVTFISVPGWVGGSQFSYMQMVFGYLIGYIVIANILLPLYYKMNLTSIYSYLGSRFGISSYKTGSAFFLLSRVIGASFRLFLVAMVLDEFVLSLFGIPFWLTVAITIILIWIYSFKAGIKTIVWTDTLQTLFMLLAVTLGVVFISKEMGLSFSGVVETISDSDYSTVFVWDWSAGNNFFKHFLSGAFITIVMTGLDQDMMQKNLSCKNLKEAKKNMYWMSFSLVPVNFLFLSLGALLFIYAGNSGKLVEHYDDSTFIEQHHQKIELERNTPEGKEMKPSPTDAVFPAVSLEYLTDQKLIGILFILGLIAAAYSSADSALTSLTTAFCVDFLGFTEKGGSKNTRYLVHIGFSVLLFLTILIFYSLGNSTLIEALFKAAGFTYGPLLGLYAFGLFTKYELKDKLVPYVAVLSPILCYFLNLYSEVLLGGYKFGFEILIVNGLLTFVGLLIISKGKMQNEA